MKAIYIIYWWLSLWGASFTLHFLIWGRNYELTRACCISLGIVTLLTTLFRLWTIGSNLEYWR